MFWCAKDDMKVFFFFFFLNLKKAVLHVFVKVSKHKICLFSYTNIPVKLLSTPGNQNCSRRRACIHATILHDNQRWTCKHVLASFACTSGWRVKAPRVASAKSVDDYTRHCVCAQCMGTCGAFTGFKQNSPGGYGRAVRYKDCRVRWIEDARSAGICGWKL